MTDIRDVRRLYDIRSITNMGNRKVIVCPLPMHPHHSNSPSFSVYISSKGVQLWKCHGACGLRGDVLDLIGYMQIPGFNPKDGEHVRRAMTLLGTTQVINPPRKERKIDPLPNSLYTRYLPAGKEVNAYGEVRGLTSETLKYFAVGQFNTSSTQWMVIPSFDGGQLKTLKMRNLHASGYKDRYQNYPGSVSSMFNINQVRNERGPVLIVKGEIVVMLLKQHGFLATSPTTGESNVDPLWYRDVMFCPKRVVVGDNDLDPKVRERMVAFTEKRAQIFHATLKFPPEQYKDLDEFILADPASAIPMIQGWLNA